MAEAKVANWEGHASRECGEHRTVGPHRAWCFDCSEWCSLSVPCVRCETPSLRARLEAAEAVIRKLDSEYDILFLPMRQGFPKWSIAEAEAIGAALAGPGGVAS